MGTRNLIMVKSSEKYKVAQYSQWDGYPLGNGFNTVQFINNPQFDRDLFKIKVDNLTEWTKQEILDLDIETYPELSRDTGTDILKLIYEDKVKKVISKIDFAWDSLFCEWGWLINLDTNCLDCFEGFQKEPLSEDQPFSDLQQAMNEDDEYYPIKLICSIPFNELSEFNTKYDFDNYIRDIINLGGKTIMDNGIPKVWNDEI